MIDTKEKSEKDIKYLFDTIDSIDVDNIRANGFSVRMGTTILKLEVSNEQNLSIEDEIRKEMKELLKNQLNNVKGRINEKINHMQSFVDTIKREYDRKEADLRTQLDNAVSMPNIKFEHASKGLSVVKGDGRNKLIWLVQGIYWPKFVDRKPIDAKFSKKMLTNIIYLIRTEGNILSSCSTRKPIGLGYFQHYHQNNPDCWGDWNPKRTWSDPYDIIKCAREAEAVLENINTGSIAKSNPAGMPRKTTLMRYVLNRNDNIGDVGSLNQGLRRVGIDSNIRQDNENMWSL